MSKPAMSKEHQRVLRLLDKHGGALSFNDLRFEWGVSEPTILAMERKGLIRRDTRLFFVATGLEEAKMTKAGQKFVSGKVRKHMKKGGKPQKQAVAIAMSQARKKGYKGADESVASWGHYLSETRFGRFGEVELKNYAGGWELTIDGEDENGTITWFLPQSEMLAHIDSLQQQLRRAETLVSRSRNR